MSTAVGIAIAIFIAVDFIVLVLFLNRRNKIKPPEAEGEMAAGGPMPTDAPQAQPPIPPPPTPETLIDKNVQFTVYRPNTIVPQKWYPLVAFAHLSKRREDAPADEPDPVKEVERQAAKLLSDQPAKYEASKLDRGFAVPRRGMLTFVPLIEGCEFNPPSQSVLWQKTVHKVEFEMMASADCDGKEVEGQMTVYLGHMILTEVPLRINIDAGFVAPETEQSVLTPTSAEPYRKIFASYSHKDTAIVEDFENYVESLGDEYLRDVETLRSGQNWSEELEHMIRDASVFQLFWSSNSMISPFVKQEWEYALGLGREKFIRPVYWEEPLPKKEPELPPKALSELHFYKLSIEPEEEEKRGGVIPPIPNTTQKSFAITTSATDTLKADARGQAQAVFVVTNATARPVRGIARLTPLGDTKREWLTISGQTERDFGAGATQQVTVKFDAAGAPAGKRSFRLDVASALNPDEDFTEGPTVSVEVVLPALRSPPKAFPMWVIAACAILVALLGIGIYVGYRLLQPPPDEPPPASPTPTPTPTIGGELPPVSPGVSPTPTPSPSPSVSPSPTPTPGPSPTPSPVMPSPSPNPPASPSPAPVKPPVIRVTMATPNVTRGGDVAFEFKVANVGGDTAGDIKITATLPPGLTFVRSKPEAAVRATTVFWSVRGIPPQQSDTFSVTARGHLAAGAVYRGKLAVKVEYSDREGNRHSSSLN